MPTVEGAGVPLAARVTGDGAPVVVVHGMAADARARSPLADALAGAGARVIAYDRRGYGASGAPEPYAATTVQEQGEDAAAVLRALAEAPALAVGDGFGALVVLDLLVRHPALVRGAVLVEPPLFAFVPQATEALAAEREALEQALREGGPGHAVERWRAGRPGPGPGPDDLERVRAAHRAFFADYGGLASWSPARRELRGLAVPVAVVTGPGSAPELVAAADALAELVPGARRRTDDDVLAATAALLAA
jgi:pimeloyl-ACP methyl ester carboxylesterase